MKSTVPSFAVLALGFGLSLDLTSPCATTAAAILAALTSVFYDAHAPPPHPITPFVVDESST